MAIALEELRIPTQTAVDASLAATELALSPLRLQLQTLSVASTGARRPWSKSN